MKKYELKALNESDLRAQLIDAKSQLQDLNFQKSISPIENPLRMRNLRREIARIETLLKGRK
ncbi:MAG: 50S ribosomal protein L29 [Bacteroidetes bacterium]|nr:50S ribosomal protein L29 [Bacteroidota bacterium]